MNECVYYELPSGKLVWLRVWPYILSVAGFFLLWMPSRPVLIFTDATGTIQLGQDLTAFLERTGMVTAYVAGLLAGLGFSYMSKARANVSVASAAIAEIEFNKQLCEDFEMQVPGKGKVRIEQLNGQRSFHEAKQHQARNLECVLTLYGKHSIGMLALGTALQVAGTLG